MVPTVGTSNSKNTLDRSKRVGGTGGVAGGGAGAAGAAGAAGGRRGKGGYCSLYLCLYRRSSSTSTRTSTSIPLLKRSSFGASALFAGSAMLSLAAAIEYYEFKYNPHKNDKITSTTRTSNIISTSAVSSNNTKASSVGISSTSSTNDIIGIGTDTGIDTGISTSSIQRNNNYIPSNVTKSTSSRTSKGGVSRSSSSKPGPKIVFLGSGSSTGCPKPICSLAFPPLNDTENGNDNNNHTHNHDHNHNIHPQLRKLQKDLESKCNISKIASLGNPLYNKNYRNNPSILISHYNHSHLNQTTSTTGTNNAHESEHEHENEHDKDKTRPETETETEIEYKNVIIDVGKTFRETALRWMPHHSVYNIDAIVITHEHADAMLGLDDLRGFQAKMFSSSSIPVYLSSKCLDRVKQQFDYLVPKYHRDTGTGTDANADTKIRINSSSSNSNSCGCNEIADPDDDDDDDKQKSSLILPPPGTPVVKRAVASLDFKVVHYYKPFDAAGLKMTPLPVMHGEDFICNGYAFSIQNRRNSKHINNNTNSRTTTNVVYLSDISRMIPKTQEFILKNLPQPTDILIIDSLNMEKDHPVHFSLRQALEVVDVLRPARTFIVGINCDDFLEHDEMNEHLKKIMKERKRGNDVDDNDYDDNVPSVQLAHDGLVIEL